MLSKEDFIRRILDGSEILPSSEVKTESSMIAGFDSFDHFDDGPVAENDGRFAQLLLEEALFGRGETLPREEVILGDQKTDRYMPAGVIYWPKTSERPYQVLLFELEKPAKQILELGGFFRQNDQLEDALHRLIQDALEGFERGGVTRTASRKQGLQSETLCVVSVLDDRLDGPPRHVVCFGTKCVETDSLEVFTLREEARDWDRPLAEEHLSQLFKRHLEPLNRGLLWQEAFISAEERKKVRKLLNLCVQRRFDEKEMQSAIRDLLEEIAGSFGVRKKNTPSGRRLTMQALPEDHGIARNPFENQARKTRNPFQGVYIFDSDERLLGYIVYVLDNKANIEGIREHFADNNHFHNVLVIYPESEGASLELWQGNQPLRGRLIHGGRRSLFDGEGGIIQLLARFFVVSRSAIKTPKQLAIELAWRAQHLKALALEELRNEQTRPSDQRPLRDLHDVFNQALATLGEDKFADAYAQTITYGLLSARWLSSDRTDVRFSRKNIDALLPSTSPFLHDLFRKLVNSKFDQNLSWLLDDITSLLSRTMVSDVFQGEQDPSIHFYQEFLEIYDPQIRREQGVYYTPDEVVTYMVRAVHTSLQERFGLSLGLADTTTWEAYAALQGISVPEGVHSDEPFVQILDPATGTGTFLLRTIEVIHETMMGEYKAMGYSPERAQQEWIDYVKQHLLPRLNGFELMMAPYIVSHLRLGLALQQTGFTFGESDRLRVFLTNTLEMRTAPQLQLIGEHVAQEAQEAERLKERVPISVIIGNPPYDRVAKPTNADASLWVLSGKVPERASSKSLFDDILDVAREHTIFSHHASLYNLYVYFWRWAIWKTLESHGSRPGMVAFITASSWLSGPGFVGLRKFARELSNDIRILDLGGDNKGANREENIFGIESPVAIGIMERWNPSSIADSAESQYLRVKGTATEKLAQLNVLVEQPHFHEGKWKRASSGFLDSLVPATGGEDWLNMPSLADLFPWQQPGCKFGRLWPVSPHPEILRQRWDTFVSASEAEKPDLFYTPPTGRNIYTQVADYSRLVDLKKGSASQPIRRYGYRSFDRQWAFEDPRLTALERPALWAAQSPHQVFLCAPMTKEVSTGPCLTVSAYVPDLDYFRGSFGGKDIIPLYRDAGRLTPNITKGLLTSLSTRLGLPVLMPEDIVAYVYCLLSSPHYQARFAEELKTPGPRVPLTTESGLWSEAVQLGKKLLWLHTFAERFQDLSAGWGPTIPVVPGLEWVMPVTQMPESPHQTGYDARSNTLIIGDGRITGVRPEVWAYVVSGMPVVKKWLGYRTSRGAGRAASSNNKLDKIRPLDWPQEWSHELLELLGVLTLTIDLQESQRDLLERICESSLVAASELPKPTTEERKEPKLKKGKHSSQLSMLS